nr:unnamed protein product [Spirometra erinaceieuropaei]
MSTPTFKNCRRLMVWMAIKFGGRPVWRSTAKTINSKVFIDIVKDAFGYNGVYRRRMDTVALQDNAPTHHSKETVWGTTDQNGRQRHSLENWRAVRWTLLLSAKAASKKDQLEEVRAGYIFFWNGRLKTELRDVGVTFTAGYQSPPYEPARASLES